jgi:threonine dehydrogenase-like Zn-dependent dehydrogenase
MTYSEFVQAVVFDHDRKIRLVDRPLPPLAGSKVLLRPSHVGICGTDLHADELGHFRPGVVMGHEFSAHVAATESSASKFSEGSLVVVNPNGNVCGECEECSAGRFNLCHSGIFERGIGVHEDGGMAEFVVVSERVLFPVPPGVSEQRAAWAEPVATAVRAVRRSGASAESSVLIVGGGPIGLLVLQVLRDVGVRRVGIVEPSSYRRAFARELGADHTYSPDELAAASRTTRSVDVTFECSGTTEGFSTALSCLHGTGTVVVIGLATHPLHIEPFRLVGSELTVLGSIIYSDDDFVRALAMLRDCSIDVDVLTTDVVPLADYATAFDALRNSAAAVKILLRP